MTHIQNADHVAFYILRILLFSSVFLFWLFQLFCFKQVFYKRNSRAHHFPKKSSMFYSTYSSLPFWHIAYHNMPHCLTIAVFLNIIIIVFVRPRTQPLNETNKL